MRYTIAVDFDGVLHSYTSPWVNARTIPDLPVPGAMDWLRKITDRFDVAITSTRNHQWFGRAAMKRWLLEHLYHVVYEWALEAHLLDRHFTHIDDEDAVDRMVEDIMRKISFPKHKPPALVYLDDRAMRFEGTFPTAQEIHQARPWNKKESK